MEKADRLIAALGLRPLTFEGGFFAETFRSSPGPGKGGSEPTSTAIYYLLTADTRSRLHRLPKDELFHFYDGDPVEMLQLFPDGTGRTLLLGRDVLGGERPQVRVPAWAWQGARLLPGGRYALLGTTMAPGFSEGDFEAGDAGPLAAAYPAFATLIGELA